MEEKKVKKEWVENLANRLILEGTFYNMYQKHGEPFKIEMRNLIGIILNELGYEIYQD